MKTLSAGDMWDEMLEYAEKVKAAKSKIRIEDDKLIINTGKSDYWIPVQGFATANGAIRWLAHIKRKRWCDDVLFQELASAMIRALEKDVEYEQECPF